MTFALYGAITWYALGQGPAYCGPVAAEIHSPFVAIPVELYSQGWQCGDWLLLRYENGDHLVAQALDAGPFSPYCVIQTDGTCPSIVIDVPEHLATTWKGTSTLGKAINVSLLARMEDTWTTKSLPLQP